MSHLSGTPYVASCAGRRLVASLLAMVALVALFGCGGPAIRFGRLPDVPSLEKSLQPMVSTRPDVLRVLGEPRNTGGAMLPGHESPHDLWVYYYEEGSLIDARRIFLFVFFLQDHYDGYMWFSSLPR
jgi:hypothetical protein